MEKRSKIIVSIIIIFVILTLLLGITYAYYLTRILGNDENKSISISTANLLLEYGDGNNTINAYNILPGQTIASKTFTVTNKGNDLVKDYVVVLENVVNNFYLRDDLTYVLSCVSVNKNTLATTGTCKGTNGKFPRNEQILIANDIDKDIMHKYTLKVSFAETNLDQSIDMNKTLQAKVNIYNRLEKDLKPTDISEMKTYLNDIDKIELLSKEYLGSSATSKGDSEYLVDKNNWLVFSTISKLSYNTSSWTQVAGPLDNNFYETFSDNYDVTSFKARKYYATDKELSSVTHFSAALAAMLYNTADYINLLTYSEEEFNDLAGWAGDLQTLINNNILSQITNQNDYNEVYNKTLELIGKTGTYFDSEDLYADVDAKNIFWSLSSSKSIKSVLENYYTNGYKNRFNKFIKLVASDGSYETLNTNINKYTKYSSYWQLLEKSFTVTTGEAVADAFTDYLWYLANFKELNIFSHEINFKKGENYNFIAEYIDLNDLKNEELTNEDYKWTVSNVDGTNAISSISNGLLTIPSTETEEQLLITITLKKSNKITSSRIITIN